MRWFISKKRIKNILETTIKNHLEQKQNTDKTYVKAYCKGVIDVCRELKEVLK